MAPLSKLPTASIQSPEMLPVESHQTNIWDYMSKNETGTKFKFKYLATSPGRVARCGGCRERRLEPSPPEWLTSAILKTPMGPWVNKITQVNRPWGQHGEAHIAQTCGRPLDLQGSFFTFLHVGSSIIDKTQESIKWCKKGLKARKRSI